MILLRDRGRFLEPWHYQGSVPARKPSARSAFQVAPSLFESELDYSITLMLICQYPPPVILSETKNLRDPSLRSG
jgi:hypothetical protein